MITLGIISPCYNEECIIQDSANKLNSTIIQLIHKGKITNSSFVLFVDDGSNDSTWDIIQNLHYKYNRICGLKLANNVGQQNAIMAGMMFIRNTVDAIVSIDADLQDDLSAIEKMIDAKNDGAEIVYGIKENRKKDSIFKRSSAWFFYKIQKLCGIQIIKNHADFRLMSKKALNTLANYHERNLYLRGIIPSMGLKSACVYYNLKPRIFGESKYSIKKMMHLASDGITSFSIRPINIIFVLGIIMLTISICILCYVIMSIIFKHNTPGWASLMISLWFIASIITISIGVVGIYIGKIYIEIKNRPIYTINDYIGPNIHNNCN